MRYRPALALSFLVLAAVSGCNCQRFQLCTDTSECSDGAVCSDNRCLPVDADGNVREPCDREGDVRRCGTDVGACTVGDQRCKGLFWTRCSGVWPQKFDACTPSATAYPGHEGYDLTCDGTLTAHPPQVVA